MLTKGQPHGTTAPISRGPHARRHALFYADVQLWRSLSSSLFAPRKQPLLQSPPPILGQSGRKTSSNLARRKTNAKPKQQNSGLSFMVSPLASVNNGACRGAVNSGVQAFIASLDWSLRPGFESKSGTSQVPHAPPKGPMPPLTKPILLVP